MKNKKTVLIFTGEANVENAQAVKDYLAKNKDNLPIIIGEEEFEGIAWKIISDRLFSEDGFVMRFVEKNKMRRQSKHIDKTPSQEIPFKNKSLAYNKAYNILIRYTPDLIILNDGSVLKEVLAARAKALPDTPAVMLIGSYVLNRRLVNKHIDRYFVDNIAIKTTLVNEGIPEQNVTIADLPLSPRFDMPVSGEELVTEYHFSPDKPTILLAVPSADNGGVREALDILKNYQDPYNIIVDCGKDREMLVAARDRNLKAINEGREPYPLYAFADIIVSRPAACVLTKAFSARKLVFALPPKGEEEARTAAYLMESLVRLSSEYPLSAALDAYKENTEPFGKYIKAVEAHNAMRPRGELFKAIDLLIDMK